MCEEFLLVDRVVKLLLWTYGAQPLLDDRAKSVTCCSVARCEKEPLECSLKRRINAIEIAPNVLDGNDAVRFFTNGRGDALLKPAHSVYRPAPRIAATMERWDRQKGQQNPALEHRERHRSPRLADQSKLPNADRLAIAPGATAVREVWSPPIAVPSRCSLLVFGLCWLRSNLSRRVLLCDGRPEYNDLIGR